MKTYTLTSEVIFSLYQQGKIPPETTITIKVPESGDLETAVEMDMGGYRASWDQVTGDLINAGSEGSS